MNDEKRHYYVCNYYVTPEIAFEWLKSNFKNNRRIDKRTVKQYAGFSPWFACANTIKFDTHGRLIDGQHRLTAIVESGVAQFCDVLYNAPPELALVIDTGRQRTLSQMLTIAGFSSGGTLSAALNSVNWIITDDTEKMRMDRAERLLEAIPDANLQSALEWVRTAQRQKLANARFLCGVFLAFGLLDESYRSLAVAVINGADPGSAAQKFRESLLQESGGVGVGGVARQAELLGRFISVHAAFKERRSLSKIYQRPGLIDSERARVKDWFARRFEAMDAVAPVAAE